MQLELWILRVQSSKQVFVPFDIKIRMQTALHQHAGAAELDRFVDAFFDLFDRMDICVWFARPPIECAKGADHVTNVGIIDVAVDDVSYNITRILALADLVRS